MNFIIPKHKQLSAYPAILSFGITIMRIIISAFAATMIIESASSNKLLITVQIFAIVLFDQLDGVCFRRSSLSSIDSWCRRRRIFDACSDRLCIQIVFLALVVQNTSLLPYYIVITVKETLTAAPCISSFLYAGNLLTPPAISKISTAGIGFIAISCLYESHVLSVLFAIGIIISGAVSMIQYRKQTQRAKCAGWVFDE